MNNWNLPNPCSGSRRRSAPGRVRWLTDIEQQRLVEAATRVDHAPLLWIWIVIALNTGMRYREITELEWSRVDLLHGLIHLEVHHTKTRRRRTVPINSATRNALDAANRWQQLHDITPDRVFTTSQVRPITTIGKRTWRTVLELAELDDLTLRDLRHVCASSIVQKGGNLYHVKELLLGHVSITTTERYSHLAPDAARSAVGLLEDVEFLRNVKTY